MNVNMNAQNAKDPFDIDKDTVTTVERGWTGMSYDLRFGVKVDGTDLFAVIGEPEHSSPTYNLSEMFRACMDWDFNQDEWYQLTDVLPKISHGIEELTMHRKEYEKYNPPSGWGSLDGALRCLRSIQDKAIDLSTNEYSLTCIPVEHLWLHW